MNSRTFFKSLLLLPFTSTMAVNSTSPKPRTFVKLFCFDPPTSNEDRYVQVEKLASEKGWELLFMNQCGRYARCPETGEVIANHRMNKWEAVFQEKS